MPNNLMKAKIGMTRKGIKTKPAKRLGSSHAKRQTLTSKRIAKQAKKR